MEDSKVKINQKFYQVLAKIVSIIFKIARVCVWVAVAAVIFVAGIVSVMTANLKVDTEKEEVTLFGVTKNYTEIKDEKIELDDDWEINVPYLKDKDIKSFVEKDLKWTLWWSVVVMSLGVTVMAFVIEFLSQGAKLFDNIAKKNTPFVKENATLSSNLLKWYIAIVIAGYIVTAIAISAFPKAEIHYNHGSLSVLLVMCLAVYLFKFGYNLEAEKKGTAKAEIAFNETPIEKAPVVKATKATATKAPAKAAVKTVKAKAPAKKAVVKAKTTTSKKK